MDVATFFDRYEAAWNAHDPQALLAFLAIPHLVATRERTVFFESEEEALRNLEALVERYEAHGAAAARIVDRDVQPLPDEAARARVRWQLEDAGGKPLIAFDTLYTLDTDEDGAWQIVAIDAQDEIDAWATAGWA